MSLKIIENYLPESEYFPNRTPKDTIYLHHTAGSHRPDWVIDWWNKDRSRSGNKIRVGTSYVIGGRSTRNRRDKKWDGLVYEAFSPAHWAHHLGLKSRKNTFLNQKSIGIEICNYGPLTVTNDGRFFTYVKTEVHPKDVIELRDKFRGYLYYHKYTNAQIDALGTLLYKISQDFDIDLSRGLKQEIIKSGLRLPKGASILDIQRWLNRNGFTDNRGMKLTEDGIRGRRTDEAKSKVGRDPFEINRDALEGYPGIYTHTNVRKDKFDCSPQPNLIRLIRSL